MSPAEATLVGRTIGSYQVVAEIGRGGMGAVYRAEHPLIGRKVAIKVILGEMSKDADTVGRFFNEARAAAGIRHPALVDVFDFGYLPEGSAYLVMDYLEGETLGARLGRGRLLPNLAVEIARQMASGMAVAHAKGIIHRDLKPENIFLTGDESAPVPQVKILDFGIAKLTGEEGSSVSASQRTRTGILMGTPLYMSPEQCRGAGAVDKRTDLYSLGCIVYAMLTGGPPFQFEAPGELIAAHLFTAPPMIRTLEPSVAPEIEAVVMRLLAKKPDDRQQSMTELERELEKVAAGASARPSTLRMPSPVEAPREVPRATSGEGGAVDTARVRTRAASVVAEPPVSDTLDAGAVARTSPVIPRRRLVPLLAIGGGAVIVLAVLLLRSSAPSAPVAAATPAARPATAPVPAVPAPSASPAAVPAPPRPAPSVAPAAPEKSPSVAVRPRAPDRPASSASPQPKAAPGHADEQVVTITAHNARAETTVHLDGHKTSLPLKLPKDGKPHTLKFETPNFEPETVEVRASRDRNITLKNRPFLLMP
jgi:eukaryotic-like serine/threonine-protein kinase